MMTSKDRTFFCKYIGLLGLLASGIAFLPVSAIAAEVNNLADSLAMQPATGKTSVTDPQAEFNKRPPDWALQALQDLVKRYDCLYGYPNDIFRVPLTRFTFALVLDPCMNQIKRLLSIDSDFLTREDLETVSSTDFFSREDLETLRRLMQEFETELAFLRSGF